MYRSKQRGFLELDLVLGTWVEHQRSYLPLVRLLLGTTKRISSRYTTTNLSKYSMKIEFIRREKV
ncbi:hypothetical protein ZWY2020_052128, partial [Hordeum vulgare]